jgi:glycosyltransferase involved in cell wall biosynthesis
MALETDRSVTERVEYTSRPRFRRLGIYVDARFARVEVDGRSRVAVNRAAPLFACAVGRHFGSAVFFGRCRRQALARDLAQQEVILPVDAELIALPDYPSLRRVPEVVHASFGTVSRMWRHSAEVDSIWVWGPHPFSIALAVFAVLRRKPVALCIREDTVQYHRPRLPSKLGLPVLGLVWSIAGVFRLLARRLPTVAVGPIVAAKYSSAKATALPIAISLVREADIVNSPPKRDWTGQITLLTVSRLEPEKNPLLLIEALAQLESEFPGRFRLVWVGRGRLDDEVRRRARELRVEKLLELRGYIPFGPPLLRAYREAHAFVHVSLTEGLPQVLIEAMAAGLPIVATDVGGVATALDGGRAGLLVPPADQGALVDAVRRLSENEALRREIARHAIRVAQTLTLEYEAERVARFIDPAPHARL